MPLSRKRKLSQDGKHFKKRNWLPFSLSALYLFLNFLILLSTSHCCPPPPDTHVHTHTHTTTQIPRDVFAQGISPLMAAPISSSSPACDLPQRVSRNRERRRAQRARNRTGAAFVYPPLPLGDKNAAALLATYTLQNPRLPSPSPAKPPPLSL